MQDIHYAGFWIRVVAYFIDTVIVTVGVFIVSFLVGGVIGFIIGINGGSPETTAIFGGVVGGLIGLVGPWLYFALQYASRFQATVGMRCVGVQVVDYDYQRISFGRATGRFFRKNSFWITFVYRLYHDCLY